MRRSGYQARLEIIWDLPALVRILSFLIFLLLIYFFSFAHWLIISYFKIICCQLIHEIVVYNNTFVHMPAYTLKL